MSEFHNPYHFVPVSEGTPPGLVGVSDFRSREKGGPARARSAPHITHDRFVEGSHSGRVTCNVTVETPLISCNQQSDQVDWTKLLEPFELVDGEPALAASGLRGMLSTVIEAATGSALRVLKNTSLSHRMAVARESLSAIGLLVRASNRRGEPILALQPLTAPTVDARPPRWASEGRDELPASYSPFFQPGFSQPLLKAYVNGYRRLGQSSVEIVSGSFLDRRRPASQSADNREYWYAKLQGSVSLSGKTVSAVVPIRDTRSGRFLLAQGIEGMPISQSEFDALAPAQQADYTRGFLRILGIEDRESEIPTTKKHEYFIPYPVGCERSIPCFDATAALEHFHQLADQRTETDPSLPFEVAGSRRNSSPAGGDRKLRLREGDLVYFRPNAEGTAIAEVSISSIWRSGNGTVHEYFSELSPDFLPLAPGREGITLAEQLLGAVEVRDKKQQDALEGKSAFALASRLRFHHARLFSAPEGGAYMPHEELLSDAQAEAMRRHGLPDIPLQNLASPKPPSPAMYFKPRGGPGAYIPKNKLNPGDHAPNGFKFYLRRDPETYDASQSAFVHPGRFPEDRAAIARQHQSVHSLVRPRTAFTFAVDFDNLSDVELGVLLYALEPNPDFRHMFGHGKPLGLGQMRIQIASLERVNRARRYGQDPLDAARFHDRELLEDAPEPKLAFEQRLAELRKPFLDWATANGLGPTLKALELVGKPVGDGTPIHYPQVDGVAGGSSDFESEHYAWFVKNDDTSQHRQPGQFLRPLVRQDGAVAATLPKLGRTQSTHPPGLGYGPAPAGGRTSARPDPPGQPAARRSLSAPPSAPVSPADCAGKPCVARVARHETKKHTTRVIFDVECEGHKFVGTLAQPDTNTDKAKYPERSEKEHAFILMNPIRSQGRWTCQLKS